MFILWFVLVMGIANSGVLDSVAVEWLSTAADWLFLVPFVGLGAEIDIAELRSAGDRRSSSSRASPSWRRSPRPSSSRCSEAVGPWWTLHRDG